MDTHVALVNRQGFAARGMRALYYALCPFFHCRCEMPESFDQEEPMIFICNHYEVFGPAAVITSLPLRYRFWTSNEMLDSEKYMEKTTKGVNRAMPLLSEKAAGWLYQKVRPLADWVFRQLDPVPVYREQPSQIIATMRNTVNKLTEGDSIILFPEDGMPRYSNGGVTEFVQGFAMVGEFYRRKTGKDLRFCPLYIDKVHRRLVFGEPVTYGQNSAAIECEIVSRELRRQMIEMAAEAGYQEENDPAYISRAASM